MTIPLLRMTVVTVTTKVMGRWRREGEGRLGGTPAEEVRNGGGTAVCHSSSIPAVATCYPRAFKNALSKHAPRFVGYDLHDSQELCAYVLDALFYAISLWLQRMYMCCGVQ